MAVTCGSHFFWIMLLAGCAENKTATHKRGCLYLLGRNYFFFSGAAAGAVVAAALVVSLAAPAFIVSGVAVVAGAVVAGAAVVAAALSVLGASALLPPQEAAKRPKARANTLSLTNFIIFCFKLFAHLYCNQKKVTRNF